MWEFRRNPRGLTEEEKAKLEGLFEKVHRATAHRGKLPRALREAARAEAIANLRSQMKRAVEAEDYEEAARLRDLLRRMEAEGTSG